MSRAKKETQLDRIEKKLDHLIAFLNVGTTYTFTPSGDETRPWTYNPGPTCHSVVTANDTTTKAFKKKK